MRDVLVTGAYGGMGHAAIMALREQGFRVFALDRTLEDAQENIIPIKTDLGCEDSIIEAFETVKKHTEGLYAVLHFAGLYTLDSLVEIDTESFHRIFDINFHGAFLVNKIFLPILNTGSRVIITTSELAPLDPLPFTGVYAITKSALDKYAYSLRMELQLLGISVSVLRAGAVDTRMLGVSTEALDKFCEKTTLYTCNADRFKRIVNRVEARRISPEKIAKKVLKIINKKNPSFAYSINRNPLLLLLNVLPKRMQLWIIKKVLR